MLLTREYELLFAVLVGIFVNYIDNVATEADNATVKPEAHNIFDFLKHGGIMPVKIGLFFGEKVEIIFVITVSEFRPRAFGKEIAPVVGQSAVFTLLYYIVITVFLLACKRSFEPFVLVGGVIDNEVHHDTDAALFSLGNKLVEVLHRSEFGLNGAIIGNIVAIVVVRALVDGRKPDSIHAERVDIVKAFKLEYPGIHVVVHEADTASLMEGLEHGEFDLCLTVLPVNEQLFDYQKICEEEMVLSVPAEYPKLQTKKVAGCAYSAINVEQIHGQKFISITETQFMQRAFDSMCAKYGVDVKKCVTVKSLEAQIAMVKAGLGMAFVPSEIKSFCKDDEVTFYSFEEDIPKREIVVAWRKDGALTKVSRELIQIMKTVSANKK